jgi:hypothetical protein
MDTDGGGVVHATGKAEGKFAEDTFARRLFFD